MVGFWGAGIYRFLNNPDTVTGYAGLYGLALIAQSWQLLALALMSQAMNFLFLVLVEIPHMKTLYPSKVRRVLCRAVLCCAVLCCAVLCCAVAVGCCGMMCCGTSEGAPD